MSPGLYRLLEASQCVPSPSLFNFKRERPDLKLMMGRRYDIVSFHGHRTKGKTSRPDLGLTTDIIAGFPGEHRGGFPDTLVVARAGFAIHAF